MSGAQDLVPAEALRLLLEQGFDSTSVEDLATAAGVSRSTFFRRYRSKEDVVFADQAQRLQDAAGVLAEHAEAGASALIPAALSVFDHHTARPELAQLRWRLLHEVSSLRDRELVSTHAYERLFRDHLLRDVARPEGGEVPRPDARRMAAVALSSAVVAVHNDFLRSWLRAPGHDVRPALERALAGLVERHGADAAGTGPTRPSPTAVVVVGEPGSTPRELAERVERALREAL